MNLYSKIDSLFTVFNNVGISVGIGTEMSSEAGQQYKVMIFDRQDQKDHTFRAYSFLNCFEVAAIEAFNLGWINETYRKDILFTVEGMK